MLIHAESLADGAVVESDVTIVGAGPAGIVLALELDKAGHRVALVESGGPRYDARTQALGDTEAFDPSRHAPMSHCTRRQIGGASVIWGGRCVPFDPVDFDPRPAVPHSQWPIGFEDVAGYYAKTSEYFFCGDAAFDIHEVAGVGQKSIVPGLPDAGVRSSELERWSLPTNFAKEYAGPLQRSGRIRLVHNLTCTEIECDESGTRVAAIRGQTLGGKTIRLKSRQYVLACGGLETTRLLLASDRRHPGGIGNHSGRLGRYYMGHISGEIARVQFTTDPRRTVFAFDRDAGGVYLRRRFSFTREFQHAQGMANIVCYLVNPPIVDPAHGNGILSFAYLALTSPWFAKYFAPEAIREALVGEGGRRGTWAHAWNMLRDGPRTAAFIAGFGYKRFVAWRKMPGFFQYSKSNAYTLHYNGEQAPNAESTVALLDETDALGMRRLKIDLRYTQPDVDNVLAAHEHLDRHLQAHGCGRLDYLSDDPEASVWEQACHGYHQCGTTRMSADPAGGVVDPNGAVHGLEDLYVASSSTFVTSGQAGSTFMIVAFALRLADHLKVALADDVPETLVAGC